MGGIDKSDMLIHLYKTPMKSKRLNLRLFAYTLGLCVVNAWLCYIRDCKFLASKGMSMKQFRLQVYDSISRRKPVGSRVMRSSPNPGYLPLPETFTMPKPERGKRRVIQDPSVRFDSTRCHMPMVTDNQTCKLCSHKDNITRSIFYSTITIDQ